MSENANPLFRKKSLERIASPERLDMAMQAIAPNHWLPLGALAAMVGVALVWSVVGRVPVVAPGRGAFVDPRVALGAGSVVLDVVAPGTGVLAALHVERGAPVRKGDVIGTVDQPELKEQLDDERGKLAELRDRLRATGSVKRQKTVLSVATIAAQRREVMTSLKNARTLTPVLRRRTDAQLASQRATLALRIKDARRYAEALKAQLAARQALREKGLISAATFMSAQADHVRAVESLAQLEDQQHDLATREAQNEQAYLQNLSDIAGLETKLKQLELQARGGELQDLSDQLESSVAVGDLERRVHQLEANYKALTEIRAEADGRVLEVTAVEGALVSRGARLGALAVDTGDEGGNLAAVCYMTIGDGMRVRPGMRVQVTPDTVKREEFGGVTGVVTRVSEFPVTTAGAANVINSEDIAREVTGAGRAIEVFVKLDHDDSTYSGYKWSSSRGPKLRIAVGTTTQTRVTIEERAPITYLLPFLTPWLSTGVVS